MLSCTNLVKGAVVFTQLILMVQGPLMCFVTRQQPVGGGQCSKRDWTDRLTFTAAGLTTNKALVTYEASIGWDWTRSIV